MKEYENDIYTTKDKERLQVNFYLFLETTQPWWRKKIYWKIELSKLYRKPKENWKQVEIKIRKAKGVGQLLSKETRKK